MQLIYGDFESFYSSKEYTLKKLTTEQYVRDPRFKAHGIAIGWPDGSIIWYSHAQLPALFASIDWKNTAICFQNAHFDGYVLSVHYGVHPAMFFCTLNMANQLIPHKRKSLEKMAEMYGLETKTVPYGLFDGIRDLPPHIDAQVGAGAIQDVRLMKQIFQRMLKGSPEINLPPFPRSELVALSETVKMFTDPILHIDIERADALSKRIIARKADMLKNLASSLYGQNLHNHSDAEVIEYMRKMLASRDQFADLLRTLGVEPPLKKAGGKKAQPGDMTYAFAKNDPGMKALLEGDNEIVVAAAEAKLSVSSTIGETRAARFASMARRGQPVPVALKWASTFSTRTGGFDATNWSNLERLPNKDETTWHGYEAGKDGHPRKGEIRLCVKAPPGHVIIVVDLSQIEARMLATNAGQHDLVERFRDPKADVYSTFIQPYFGYAVSKKTPSERGIGKQLVLSAGYMAGGPTIKTTAALGSYGPPVHLTLEEAEKLKVYYRTTNNKIPEYWQYIDEMFPILLSGGRHQMGPILVDKHRMWLPNGAFLDYSTLHRYTPGPDEPEWKRNKPQYAMQTMQGYTRVHKGIACAHITSSLSRLLMTDAMTIVAQRYKVAMTCYDELVLVVRDEEKEEALAYATEVMKRPPRWLPQLPVDAEGHYSLIYDK